MTAADAAEIVYRKDYQKPDYLIKYVHLDFLLDRTNTKVTNRMIVFSRVPGVGDLKLHGSKDLRLESVTVAGKRLTEGTDYVVDTVKGGLTIKKSTFPTHKVKQPFEIEIVNYNNPSENKLLEGLYESGGILCTQCEAEGFRNITYFLDRPDCLAQYTVRLQADKTQYPILLSNGDCIRTEPDLPQNQHAATFIDPFPKPSYLFALIAGVLGKIETSFTTCEGAEVAVECYAAEKYLPRCQWALEVAVKAMRFDEVAFGRVYDLSTFRLVCLEDFNAGAMENKSLCTFNISSILADRESATDSDFERVLATVGHEYFHNWSGDRVTIQDWFQITLKEGFTHAREEAFVADNFSHTASLISSVIALRAAQFPEDSSPLAHPIRLESYECVDNFYTVTVYNKGGQVIEMFRALLGVEGFRAGCDLYFKRHDGEAVSCDEFIKAMADANDRDLSQMDVWYSQAGTPVVQVLKAEWNKEQKSFTFRLRQVVPTNALPDGQKGRPYLIPVKFGLVGKESNKDLVGTKVVELTDLDRSFTIFNVPEDATLSLLRGFSAPVKVEQELSFTELAHLMAYDSDGYIQWDCGQRIFKRYILEEAANPGTIKELPEAIEQGIREALKNRNNDWEFVAMAISLPPLSDVEGEMKPYADPIALYRAMRHISSLIAAKFESTFRELFEKFYAESKSKPWSVSAEDVGRRSMQNRLLSYLTSIPYNPDAADAPLTPEQENRLARALQYLKDADNFNDRDAAMRTILANAPVNHPAAVDAAQFTHQLCNHDASMVDQWATVYLATRKTSEEAKKLLYEAPEFSDEKLNPNRAYSIIRGFASNYPVTHANDGSGYMLLAEQVIRCDKFGSVANKAAKRLIAFQYYNDERKALMKKALQWILDQKPSDRVIEIVQSGLKN